jgi:hypothetical protein
LILIAVKLASAVAGALRVTAHLRLGKAGFILWAAGKIAPTLFCLCFFVDAIVMKRSRAMIAFWAALSVAVPIFTWWVVYVRR